MQTLTIEVSDDYADRLNSLLGLFPKSKLKVKKEQSSYEEEFLKRYPTKESYMSEIKRDVELYKEGRLETSSFDGFWEEMDNKIEAWSQSENK